MKKVYRITIFYLFLFFALFSPTTVNAQCDDLTAMIFSDPEGPYNLCPGEVITLTAIISGGTPPYNILWSGGSTAPSIVITPPFQGGVDLIITDANDCDGYAHIHIKAFPWTVEIITSPTPICEGELYGIYTWPDFPAGSTFLWSTGETTNNIFVPVAGTYSVTATSPSGACSASVTETIAISTSPTPAPTISGPTDLCSGQSVTLSVPNDPNEFYLWNTGAETATITTSTPGTYSVTVTNNFGCSGFASIEVVSGVPPLDLIGPAQLCTGESGVIFVNNFFEYNSFLWSTGATTSSINVNAPGDYSVTATGTGGCTATGSVSIIGGSANFTVSGTTTQPTSGLDNGAINVTGSPSGTYTYNWSNGSTTQDLTNLSPGTYSVTVTGEC